MLTAAFLATARSSTPSAEAEAQDTQAKGYYGLEPSVVVFQSSAMTHLHVSVEDTSWLSQREENPFPFYNGM